MKAAIQTFGSMQRLQKKRGRKILVMGDMLELGDYAQQAHYEAGECAGRTDIDIIICVGQLSRAAVKGAQEVCSSRPEVLHFDDKEQRPKSCCLWCSREIPCGQGQPRHEARGGPLQTV